MPRKSGVGWPWQGHLPFRIMSFLFLACFSSLAATLSEILCKRSGLIDILLLLRLTTPLANECHKKRAHYLLLSSTWRCSPRKARRTVCMAIGRLVNSAANCRSPKEPGSKMPSRGWLATKKLKLLFWLAESLPSTTNQSAPNIGPSTSRSRGI